MMQRLQPKMKADEAFRDDDEDEEYRIIGKRRVAQWTGKWPGEEEQVLNGPAAGMQQRATDETIDEHEDARRTPSDQPPPHETGRRNHPSIIQWRRDHRTID